MQPEAVPEAGSLELLQLVIFEVELAQLLETVKGIILNVFDKVIR